MRLRKHVTQTYPAGRFPNEQVSAGYLAIVKAAHGTDPASTKAALDNLDELTMKFPDDRYIAQAFTEAREIVY